MIDFARIEGAFQASPDNKCAVGQHGMVASAFPAATEAGIEMLRQGGNAVDAACATALALGVCEPQASGIGGQTMAILHIEGKTIAIDGSTRAPSLAHLSHFNGKTERRVGYRATTVPSTLAVLGYLNYRYGRLRWAAVVEPAIRIARDGYAITPLQSQLQARSLEKFESIPSQSGARYFLKEGKQPYQPGDLFVQPDLANLLAYVAANGANSFYRGEIAQQIDADMQANEGFLRVDDLAHIPFPIERRPLKRQYRGLGIATLPPPAAGRTLLLTLMMLNNLPVRFIRQATPEMYHFFAEIFRKAFLLRTQRPFDPNTYPQIPEKKMMTRSFAREMAISIHDTMDMELPLVDPPSDGGETTHLSVMDREGNAVGITQSIELVYGARVAAAGLGFLYNNYMNAFEINEPSHPYYLRPNGIPWTSVAPAILFHKDEPWMVVGSPGSERIYSTVSQFISMLLDRRMPMGEAMRHPRFHCSIGGRVSLEADRFDPAIVEYLASMGYKIDHREPFAFYLGAIHAVMKCQSQAGFQGVAEVRRDGSAAGL